MLALFASLFPDVMPASNDPANSLTIANASSTTVHAHGHELDSRSSSCRSCSLYQGWTYWVFRKRVTRASIEAAAH